MAENKINLTHYDLDGVVSSILIEELFLKGSLYQIYPVGYNYLDNTLQKLLFKHGILYITDLRITPEQMNMLSNFKTIHYYDHHQRSNNEQYPEFIKTCVIDTTKCAAKIIYDKYNKQYPEIQKYEQLVEWTNDYDMWLHNYKASRVINAYFWHVKFEVFKQQFMKQPDTITDEMKKVFDEKEKHILQFINDKRYEVIENVCIVIDKDVDMELTLYLPYEHYFFMSSSNRLHLKSTKDLTQFFEHLKNEPYIESIGGHKNAGGVVITNPDKAQNVLKAFIEYVNQEVIDE